MKICFGFVCLFVFFLKMNQNHTLACTLYLFSYTEVFSEGSFLLKVKLQDGKSPEATLINLLRSFIRMLFFPPPPIQICIIYQLQGCLHVSALADNSAISSTKQQTFLSALLLNICIRRPKVSQRGLKFGWRTLLKKKKDAQTCFLTQ